MIALHLTICDHTVLAKRTENEWQVTICTHLYGHEETQLLTDPELAAIIALSMGLDDVESSVATKEEHERCAEVLYKLAEPAMAKFSTSLREILP